MKNECVGLWGRMFGHNYQAIHDEKKDASKVPEVESIKTKGAVDLQDLFDSYVESYTSTEKTYKHSICSRCGNIIK
jgi:hypothetical protein